MEERDRIEYSLVPFRIIAFAISSEVKSAEAGRDKIYRKLFSQGEEVIRNEKQKI